MTKIKCSVESCAATFESDVPLSPKATYTCRTHTRPSKDEDRFQKHQFDKELRRAGKPLGTSHIRNQGSDVMTSGDIESPHSWEVTEDIIVEDYEPFEKCDKCDAQIVNGQCEC